MAVRKMSITFPAVSGLKERQRGLVELNDHLTNLYWTMEGQAVQKPDKPKLSRMRLSVDQLLRENRIQLQLAERYAKMRPSTRAKIEVING